MYRLFTTCCAIGLWTAMAAATVDVMKSNNNSNDGTVRDSDNVPSVTRKDGMELFMTPTAMVRQLQTTSDFDRFNELFQGTSINIEEDFSITETVLFIPLTLNILNVKCYDISVGNIILDHNRRDNQNLDVTVDIEGLRLNCDVDYNYKYGLLHGTGIARVTTDNNSASTTLSFQSVDFSSLPPSSSSMGECVTNIEITGIDFAEDFLSDVVELAERWIRDLIGGEIERVACDELGTLGTTFIADILALAEDFLLGYQDEPNEEVISNPLFLEETTVLPDDMAALNFKDTENFMGSLFNQAVQLLDDLLGGIVPDPDSPNGSGTDLGVNVFLRSSLLNEDRTLVVSVDQFLPDGDAVLFKGHDQLTETVITLNEIRVMGLDTFTRFNPLIQIGKHTLENELSWEYLTLEVDVTLDIKPSTREDAILQGSTSEGITERINIDIGVENLDVVAALFLVVDEEALGGMEVGSLLQMDNLLPCLLSIVHSLQLSGLHVDPQVIGIPTLTGFVSPGIDRIITEAVEAAFDMYSGVLEYAIPNVFQTSVRRLVNEQVIDVFFSSSGTSECPGANETTSDAALVDFRQLFDTNSTVYGDLPTLIIELLDTELLASDPDTGNPKINKVLIDPFTEKQSGVKGTLMYAGDLFDTGARISVGGLDADIQLRASDAKVENLNTITTPLALMEPMEMEPYFLNNTATMGVGEPPLRLSGRFFFSIADDEDTQIANDLDISLDLDTTNVIVTAMLKIAESKLLGFPLRDIFDLNCWIATIPAPLLDAQGIRLEGEEATLSLEEIVASVSRLNLNVTCVECSSPGMLKFTELLATPEAQADATEVVNMLLDSATRLMSGSLLQVQIDRMLNDASRKCPHSANYDPNPLAIEYAPLEAPVIESNTATYLALVGATVLGMVVAVALLMFIIRCIVRRRHRRFLASIPAPQANRLRRLQQHEDAVEAELNDTTVAMFRSPDVPCFLRWGMPVVILGNIGLFLSGHLSLGATVNIEAQIAGETIRVDNFFEFSMAKSTIDIWNAGGKELAILILIFSGIWPYTKQIITLALWFIPPSRVSISKRGSILLWLDWLAKWSMIDIFVLVVSIAAFRVSIQSPEVLFLPEGFYSIDLLVVPLWGLYANMTAQLVSQISSHFIIHYHRQMVNTATNTFMERHHNIIGSGPQLKHAPSHTSLDSISGCDTKRLLRKHQFGRPHRGETEKLVVHNWVSYAVMFTTALLVVLVVLGCTLPSFSLEVLGLVGVAVESGQGWEDATTNFNIFTVINLLMEEARFLDTVGAKIGLGTMNMLFFVTVLLVPIFQALALLRQWFSPLNMEQRTRMSVLNEVLQAWQYAEVYLIAIFVASWQLGPISEFMINSYCDSLSDFFGLLVYFGILKEEDAQCFSVQSSIESGFFVLAAGAILLAVLNTFVVKAVRQYIRDKSELEKQVLDDKNISDFGESSDEEGGPMKNADAKEDPACRIHPAPVLFTDTFRWLLQHDDGVVSSSRAFEAHYDLPKSSMETDSGKNDSLHATTTVEVQYTTSGSNIAEDQASEATGAPVPSDISDGVSLAAPSLPFRIDDEEGERRVDVEARDSNLGNAFDVVVDDAYVVVSDNDGMSSIGDHKGTGSEYAPRRESSHHQIT